MRFPSVTRLVDCGVGTLFCVAVTTKILAGGSVVEEWTGGIGRHVASWVWWLADASVVAAEAYVGTALLVMGGRRVRRTAIALLAVLLVALTARGMLAGWSIRCACFGGVWESSVSMAIVRNIVLCLFLLRGAVGPKTGQGRAPPRAPLSIGDE